MNGSIEQIARKEIQKVRDSSLASGFFTGLKVIKDIIDDYKKTNDEKVTDIKAFIDKTLPIVEPKK